MPVGPDVVRPLTRLAPEVGDAPISHPAFKDPLRLSLRRAGWESKPWRDAYDFMPLTTELQDCPLMRAWVTPHGMQWWEGWVGGLNHDR